MRVRPVFGFVWCLRVICSPAPAASMDGDVRLADLIHQADGSIVPRVELLSRSPGDMALKIEFLPEAPSSFLVTHQDGNIRLTDLRAARRPGLAGDAPEQTVVALDMVRRSTRGSFFVLTVAMVEKMVYSLCFDPCNPHQFVASCGSSFVHQYDLRMQGRPYSQPVKYWVDGALPGLSTEQPDLPSFRRHVTDVHFGASGNLLVNYSGHDVVLLSGSVVDQNGMGSHVLQRFTGRVNEETFLKYGVSVVRCATDRFSPIQRGPLLGKWRKVCMHGLRQR